jgi:hypothetical protein
MKFFRRQRASVMLVRAWCSPFGEDGPAGELLALVDAVLDVIHATPLEGSINHGHVQEMSSLRRALAKMKPMQLDALTVRDEADEVICAAMPTGFRAVGLAYDDFPQASDAEVRTLLDTARRDRAPAAP